MTPSEVRFEEDLNEIESLNFIKLSLGDVLMHIESGEIYTPNTNTKVNQDYTNVVQNGATGTSMVKGGEKDASGGEK